MTTRYRKPKFTPDPPLADVGDLSGLSTEEKLDRFIQWTKNKLDWTQREVYRIEDLWPNDQSLRIEILEDLVGCISEPITMLAYGTIGIEGYDLLLQLSCGTTELLSDGVYESSNEFIHSIVYSPKNDLVMYAFARDGSETSEITLFAIKPATGAVNTITTNHIVTPAIPVSSSGLSSNDKLIYTQQLAGANSQFTVWNITSTSFTTDTSVGNPLGGNNIVYPLDETDSYVAFSQQSDTDFAVADKATWTFSDITVPSGWEHSVDAAARRSSNSFLVPLEKTSTGDYSFFSQTGTGNIDISDKLVDCDTDITNFKSTGKRVGNKVFWAVDRDGVSPDNSQILVTDTNGTQLALFTSTLAGGNWSAGQSYWKFTVESDTHIWWFEDAKVFRMDVDTYVIESCTPDPVAGRIAWGSAVQLVGDDMYIADGRALDAGSTDFFRVIARTPAFVI